MLDMDLYVEKEKFQKAEELLVSRGYEKIIAEIIEKGDHDTLIEEKGKYYKLYTGQFELS